MLLYSKEQQYLPLIMQFAQKYNVPPALVLGHMKQESNFKPLAYRGEPQISDASSGLMQILLGTAKTMDVSATQEKLFDPAYNIDLGTRYIAQNLIRYGGNIQDAIAAYNAGSAMKNQAGQYTAKSGNTSVQGYVDKVYKNYVEYDKWLNAGAHEVSVSAINPFLLVTLGAMILAAIVGTVIYARKRK